MNLLVDNGFVVVFILKEILKIISLLGKENGMIIMAMKP